MRLLVTTSFVVLFLFCAGLAALAQVTTSGLSGRVIDTKKEALVGATVQATYTPTGTKYAAVTDVEGRYRINNMNAGGPYEVVVTYVSYQIETRSDVVLQLGEITSLNIILQDASTQLFCRYELPLQ